MAGFHHEALFYSDAREFIAGTLPFVRAGLDAGEPVMVALPEPNAGRLRWALGSAAKDVLWVDMIALGRNPACIIPGWREFVDVRGSGGQAVRGIGEPAWAGRQSHETVECGHHESLLNLAFEDAHAFQLLCPYDASQLPRDVLEEARHNHPFITHEGACGDYLDPRGRPGPFTGLLLPLGEPDHRLAFTIEDLSALRVFTAAHAHDAGMDRHRVLDLVVAISELAGNSVVHGGGRGELLTWLSGETFVCEVRDGGLMADPLAGRVHPPTEFDSGRGLWLVNQLCDLVQIRSSTAGTTVRVYMAVDDELAAPAEGEEGAQDLGALLATGPGVDDGPVVEPWLSGDVED